LILLFALIVFGAAAVLAAVGKAWAIALIAAGLFLVTLAEQFPKL